MGELRAAPDVAVAAEATSFVNMMAPKFTAPVVSPEDLARGGADEPAPSALEQQVADLRKRQAALEAIWADKAWKHRSTVVEDHIAALAARATRSAPAEDTADAEAVTTAI